MEVIREKTIYPTTTYASLPVIQASQVNLTRRKSTDAMTIVNANRQSAEEQRKATRRTTIDVGEHNKETDLAKPVPTRVQYRRLSRGKEGPTKTTPKCERMIRRASEPTFYLHDVSKKLHIANEKKAATLETDKVTIIQPLQSFRPATVSDATGKRLITYANKRFIETKPISTRGGSTASPLAQYGNDFSSLFPQDKNARIFRTPVRTTTSAFSFGSSLQVPSNTVGSRTTLANKLLGSTAYDAYDSLHGISPVVSANGSIVSMSSASGRKSALRNPNDPVSRNNRVASGRLRVSFAKSPDVKTNVGFILHNTVTSPRPPSRSEPELPAKDIIRPISKVKAQSRRLAEGSHTEDSGCTLEPVCNAVSDATESKPSSKNSSSQLATAKKDGGTIPSLRHRKDVTTVRTVHHNAVPIGNDLAAHKSVMALTADQLLVRKSVEKVQKWIDTLPRHFSTIHHVMSPVQQDY